MSGGSGNRRGLGCLVPGELGEDGKRGGQRGIVAGVRERGKIL